MTKFPNTYRELQEERAKGRRFLEISDGMIFVHGGLGKAIDVALKGINKTRDDIIWLSDTMFCQRMGDTACYLVEVKVDEKH